jgi:deoxyribodipyrimidine photo-lyase
LRKIPINIVWLKRDLRFTDHEPLYAATQQDLPILLIYFFEPSVMAYDDSDTRHWRFVFESLQEMQGKLIEKNTQIFIFHNEVTIVFNELLKLYDVKNIFSHQEVGNKITYDRDIAMQVFCKQQNIVWKEFQLNGKKNGSNI